MRNYFREAKHRLLQLQVHIIIQIVTDSLENIVRRLLYLKHDVTLEHIRYLFALALEDDRFSIFHASLHINCEFFTFVH